jgi:hypothetical protein
MFSGNEVFLYILVDFLDPLSQNVIQGSRMLSADDVRALSTPRGKGKAWISTEKKDSIIWQRPISMDYWTIFRIS